MTIENLGHWGNSRHKGQGRGYATVSRLCDTPIINSIEFFDPDYPHKKGDTCEIQRYSALKGFTNEQAVLTGRATYTLASGLMVEVEGGGWTGFKVASLLRYTQKSHKTPVSSVFEDSAMNTSTASTAPYSVKPAQAVTPIALLPAPKIAGLLPAPELKRKSDPFAPRGFLSVYDVTPSTMTALDLDYEFKFVAARVTLYGTIDEMKKARSYLLFKKYRVSEVHKELPLSENLMYRYSWKSGTEMRTLRREYQKREVKAA